MGSYRFLLSRRWVSFAVIVVLLAGLAWWLEENLLPLRGLPPAELAERLPPLWAQLDRQSLLVSLKLLTGAFRVGVSKLLVTRALASLAGLDAKRVAQRLVGYTDLSHRPSAQGYLALIAAESVDEHAQRGGQHVRDIQL